MGFLRDVFFLLVYPILYLLNGRRTGEQIHVERMRKRIEEEFRARSKAEDSRPSPR